MLSKVVNGIKIVGEGICLAGLGVFIMLIYAIVIFDRALPIVLEQGNGIGAIMIVILPLIGLVWLILKLPSLLKLGRYNTEAKEVKQC